MGRRHRSLFALDDRKSMSASAPQNHFLLTLAILLVVHTAVSAAVYRLLTKTKVQEWPKDVPVETTTPEQAQRGEKVFIANKRVVSRSVPWPVPCYILCGYAGLGVAVVIWIFHQARAAQP